MLMVTVKIVYVLNEERKRDTTKKGKGKHEVSQIMAESENRLPVLFK